MKKIFLMLSIALAITCTACENKSNQEQFSETFKEQMNFTDEICRLYENGEWNGERCAYTKNHCASVVDGILWIDNLSTGRIVDVGTQIDFDHKVVIGQSEKGTFIKKDDCIELWKRGQMIKRYDFPISFKESYQVSESSFAFMQESNLLFWNNGNMKIISDQALDIAEYEDGIYYTTFNHEMYYLDEDGQSYKIKEDVVYLPETPIHLKITSQYGKEVYRALFNALEDKSWSGENIPVSQILGERLLQILSESEYKEIFARIDYNKNLYINNQIMANKNLGNQYLLSKEGCNIKNKNGCTFYADGEALITYYEGLIVTKEDIADGQTEILAIENFDKLVAIKNQDTTFTIQAVKLGQIITITEEALDFNVTNNLLYWMDINNNVYTYDWIEENAENELFFENAIAVSHSFEGAIVNEQYANCGKNIYNPCSK